MRHLFSLIILVLVFLAGFLLGRGGVADFSELCKPLRPEVVRGAINGDERKEETAKVAYVIDGDTVVLSDGRKVRYIGINSPELGRGPSQTRECFASQAAARNRALTEGKEVRLVRDHSDVDKFGRLLRYVYVDDKFVNELLVREGFARARTYPPDVSKQEELEKAQAEARAAGRGLWGQCEH